MCMRINYIHKDFGLVLIMWDRVDNVDTFYCF